MADRTPTIVGAALSDYPIAPHLTERGHHAQALMRSLDDAGLSIRDLDGFMSSSMTLEDPIVLAEYFRIDHKVLGGAGVGGAIFEWMLHQACAHIRDGQAETIAITYGSDLLTRTGRTLGTGGAYGSPKPGTVNTTSEQFEMHYGSTIVSDYALAAKRHMHEYGTTPQQLAQIAVLTREHAGLNPHARYKKPITIDDVLNSRMVADPLHMLDSCVITDGGGAIIVTTAERAKDLKSKPAYVLGTAASQSHLRVNQWPDFTLAPSSVAGPRAMAQAGLTHKDIDTLQLYDSFTITVLMMLEGLGFCKRGEGGPFVETGALKLGGRWPMNTDGGGLSACHSGMRGMHILVEAVRQVRGECGPRQVENAKTALVCGSGYTMSGQAVAIIGSEHP